MPFTKEEAEAKIGRWVCVRHNELEVPKGTRGKVVDAQVQFIDEFAVSEEFWIVLVRLPYDSSEILPFGKEEYERDLEEI